ncbi:alpha/beta hydrolase family esterase [Maribacter halichondriae]|uniref:alpha/beta hydrolase family esterase n=1 Tax=Maribacter halichondriae TaxID=2980554 RepID=UPI00235A3D06|nr:PHB depolymerase family esterase [Maribacter sp. Hal144]
MKNTENNLNRPCTEPKWNWVFMMLPLFLFMMNSCSKDDDSPTDTLGEFNTKTIQHDGVERTYHMYLPSNFDESNDTPLVFALHGGGGTGTNFEDDVSAGTLTTAAESRGMILIMPNGIDKRWNDGRPEIFGNDSMYDDVGFIAAIIDDMIQNYGVDANRVYVTGISNGGLMSIRLAMDLSNKITAIAPVTAQITTAIQSKVPELPISIMIVNGEEDPLVPYNGGCILGPFVPDCMRGEVLSTAASIEKFVDHNQCANPSETQPIIDTIPTDGTSVEISGHKGCEQGTEVVLVRVIGGGHTWPSGAQYLSPNLVGVVSKEINASEMILDFFLSHSRN